MKRPILQVEGLTKKYHGQIVVDSVSFDVGKEETLGIVGESGSGKSTLAKMLLGLIPCDAGKFRFQGNEMSQLSESGWRSYRKQIQIVFQDPYSTLNPKMTLYSILEEPLLIHRLFPEPSLRRKRVEELFSLVDLDFSLRTHYPHELSGGQRQRVGIARALATEPSLLILDEPVSALDVSIQAQILDLLLELQEKKGLSYVFISHDLRVIQHLSHRIGVMSKGKLIELGPCEEIYANPQREETRALLNAIPKLITGT